MPEWLIDLFARYGYAVVFFGVFLENTGLPVPGETALLAGAALSHFGRLALPWVVVTAVAAAVLGDNLGFFIGHHYGRGLIERYGAMVGLTRARLDEFDRFFDRHGGRTVFVARFITGLRVFGALLAGASGLRWSTFLFYNAAGAIVWSIAIATAGYSLAYSWETLERWVGRSGLIGLALVVAVGAIALIRARRKHDS
jgi:membrane protein DedA with SNARE-associated domain